MLAAWEEGYTDGVIALWNAEAVRDGYKELDKSGFASIFTGNLYFDPLNAFVLLEQGQVAGFACGCTGSELPLGDKAGYITCIVLDERYALEANYIRMLTALERRFAELGRTQADVLFFNPMQLPWMIPGTPGHEHNNAPGVPVGSRLHAVMLKQGYAERTQEQAMYLDLSGFSVPEDIRAKEAAASAKGYAVGVLGRMPVGGDGGLSGFARGEVQDIKEMLEGLNNPLWTKEIAESAADGTPVVFAAKDGRAAGFAGPVIRQPNGRGYFAGIGVHPDHEGYGLGTVLFFQLCEAFRAIGTPYMSLYTGIGNPAARIYEKAGFKAVKYFAVMRKELS